MTATGATETGNMLVLTIDVERLHGCSAEHPLGHKTPVGQCQLVAIGFPDGGTVLRMDGQTSDYRVELAAPGGAELIAAILANAKPFPPGMVIASASDVVSPEQRAAIGRMSASLDDLLTDYDDASAEQSVTDRALNCLDSLRRFANKVDRLDDLAVLRAIVGGQGK